MSQLSNLELSKRIAQEQFRSAKLLEALLKAVLADTNRSLTKKLATDLEDSLYWQEIYSKELNVVDAREI